MQRPIEKIQKFTTEWGVVYKTQYAIKNLDNFHTWKIFRYEVDTWLAEGFIKTRATSAKKIIKAWLQDCAEKEHREEQENLRNSSHAIGHSLIYDY